MRGTTTAPVSRRPARLPGGRDRDVLRVSDHVIGSPDVEARPSSDVGWRKRPGVSFVKHATHTVSNLTSNLVSKRGLSRSRDGRGARAAHWSTGDYSVRLLPLTHRTHCGTRDVPRRCTIRRLLHDGTRQFDCGSTKTPDDADIDSLASHSSESDVPVAVGPVFSVTVSTLSRPPEMSMSNKTSNKTLSAAESLSAPTGHLRRRVLIAVPLSIGLAIACGVVTGLIGRIGLGLPVGAGINVVGHAFSGAVAGMLAGTAAVVLYEHWARRRRANDKVASQALTSGIIGAVISAAMAALVNGIVIGVPTSLASQTANHVVTGIISGAIAAFIGLMVHQTKTAAL